MNWERDLNAHCIRYKALRDIRAGEELCINYGILVSDIFCESVLHKFQAYLVMEYISGDLTVSK